MKRIEEWNAAMGGRVDSRITEKLIAEAVFLEQQLEALQKLPFVKVHPSDSAKQKATPAARQYVQLSAQYNSVVRTLLSISKGESGEEESPLRKWMKEHASTE